MCRADGNVSAAAMENMVVPQKIKPRIAIYAAIPLMGTYPKEIKEGSQKDIYNPMFTAALFERAKR